MNKFKGRGLVDFSKRYHQRNMWENITLEIWELLDWEALIPTIPSVAWTSGGLMDSDRSISCMQAECHDTTWRWCSSLKRSCSETSGGTRSATECSGTTREREKKEEERQNEKRRPALMQRRGRAGYYEFFRNLKDSSKAWLSVAERAHACASVSAEERACTCRLHFEVWADCEKAPRSVWFIIKERASKIEGRTQALT